jgi:shikimate dehydrogenase/3-dehydroquinate dehydratase type I
MMSEGARVCETVVGDTLDELRRRRDASEAELVELRLDGVADAVVAGALDGRRTPVIITCRARHDGGRFDGSENERLRILAEAIALGAEYVDVEWSADRRGLPRADRTVVVLSHHDFDATPADLADRVHAMRAETTGPIKVAVMARTLGDCVRLREAVAGAGPRIAIAMGGPGLVTRLCPFLFGSLWTYSGSAAPGQTSARTLIERYRVRETSTSTAIYGLAGAPLAHSASPAIHNAAFAETGLDAVYVPLESADAEDFDESARALGIRGASVTAPLKEALIPHLAEIDSTAFRVGAVNTLRRSATGWEGTNFDVAACLAPLARREVPLLGRAVVVLGAGGAARAAARALADAGANVRISARRPDRAAALARAMGVEVAAWPPPPGWDLLVNATPVGTWPDETASPVDQSHLVAGSVVYDLVYNPAETALLQLARNAGAEVIGGLEMLVDQAIRQFEWWTGTQAPAAVMDAAAREFLEHEMRAAS